MNSRIISQNIIVFRSWSLQIDMFEINQHLFCKRYNIVSIDSSKFSFKYYFLSIFDLTCLTRYHLLVFKLFVKFVVHIKKKNLSNSRQKRFASWNVMQYWTFESNVFKKKTSSKNQSIEKKNSSKTKSNHTISDSQRAFRFRFFCFFIESNFIKRFLDLDQKIHSFCRYLNNVLCCCRVRICILDCIKIDQSRRNFHQNNQVRADFDSTIEFHQKYIEWKILHVYSKISKFVRLLNQQIHSIIFARSHNFATIAWCCTIAVF